MKMKNNYIKRIQQKYRGGFVRVGLRLNYVFMKKHLVRSRAKVKEEWRKLGSEMRQRLLGWWRGHIHLRRRLLLWCSLDVVSELQTLRYVICRLMGRESARAHVCVYGDV